MTQKTTTCTTPSPVEAFALHLRSQGYALISLLVALSCAISTQAPIIVSIPCGTLRSFFRELMESTMAVRCISNTSIHCPKYLQSGVAVWPF